MTIEEILEAVKNTPTLAPQILANVPTLPGGAEYLQKANKAYFDENVGSEVSKIYNGIDEDIFNLTGKRKKADQKTYDFVKEIVGDLKKKADDLDGQTPEEVKQLKTTIKDLEEKLKNGESSSHWKKSYEEVVEQLRTKTQEYTDELKKRDQQILSNQVDVDITAGLGSLKLNETLPEAVRKAYINQHKNELIANAQIIDGKVVYHDAEGKPLRDQQFNPASAEYLLKERLKDILAVEKTPGGGAPQGGKGEVVTVGTGDSATKKLVLDKGSFKTRQEFLTLAEKSLADQGITREGNKKEYQSIIDQAYADYGVSELSRV